ncbi:MAG: tRNA preQ1(34) S-adenosylmethionine ribosyltransferase-isomerase QueA [Myxococcota bacterium]|nr:tRNA preQ1(34) S-adenosylmethionine ribosyltransferase-isomerase QueA [Myxococcota bacterium]
MDAFEERLAPYDYVLPESLIARYPSERRDGGRLLVVGSEENDHRRIRDLPDFLDAGDVLVVNDTRVMPARVACRRSSGGSVEGLFLEEGAQEARALLRPSRRLRVGEVLSVGDHTIELMEKRDGGEWGVRCSCLAAELMAAHGEMPLPPYMRRSAGLEDKERYQTIFAAKSGAVAAPTASLHLTEEGIGNLEGKGVRVAKITLHVGIGTFRNLRPEDLQQGRLHPEWYSVPEDTVDAIRNCRRLGGRVVAVGTTVARTLESATPENHRVPRAGEDVTRLFLREGASFRCVDGLMTNFHLPRSSLLMLVCAFGGRKRILSAYQDAIQENYRFYSYGDSMLIL